MVPSKGVIGDMHIYIYTYPYVYFHIYIHKNIKKNIYTCNNICAGLRI